MSEGQRFSFYHGAETQDAIRQWLAPYAREFQGCRYVLDIGCGPGTFLELLRELGVQAIGIDPDPEMVAQCQAAGLQAAVMYADDLPRLSGEFDGVHIGHVVEHLTGAQLERLLLHLAERLLPGGRVLIRTPNWANAQVHGGGFWLDHTHQRPYPAELLVKMLQDLGLSDVHAESEPGGWNDTVVRASRPQAPGPTRADHVHWEGSQFKYHSLALVNREVCLALLRRPDIELSLTNYEAPRDPSDFDPAVDPRLGSLVERLANPPEEPAEVVVSHRYPPRTEKPSESVWVLMQPWEMGAIPAAWQRLMRDAVDEVWVYSAYNRRCYVRCGVPAEKVHVIPLGIDPDRFRPSARPLRLPTERSFRFLYVGGTLRRKGFDILLETYLRTFSARDDVALVVKDMGVGTFYQGQTMEETIWRLQVEPDAPELVYLTDDIPDAEMPGLYTACHAVVQPYRGEGFGLPILEAMACGLPAIVTGHGAALDYCAPDRALLVPASEVRGSPQTKFDGQALVDRPWWAEVDRESLAAAMRMVVDQPENARSLGAAASIWVRANMTWTRTAEAVARRVHALVSQPAVQAPEPAPPAGTTAIAYPDWSDDLEAVTAAVQRLAGAPDRPSRLVFLADPADPEAIERAATRLRQVAASIGKSAQPEILLFYEFDGDDDLPEVLGQADLFIPVGASERQRHLTRLALQAGLEVRRTADLPTDSVATSSGSR